MLWWVAIPGIRLAVAEMLVADDVDLVDGDFGPSLIANTTSTRFWSSWTICGSTLAA